jgi:hypothetical protein
MMTLIALFTALPAGAHSSRAAQPAIQAQAFEGHTAGVAASAGTPVTVASCRDRGWVPVWDGPEVNARSDGGCGVWRADSAAAARDYVHNWCYGDGYPPDLDGFCTIQRWGGLYYIYEFWGCDLWDLRGFGGLWDTHNHGEASVWFYDAPDSSGVQRVIGKYAGHRSTAVNWDPVWTIRTCA